MAISDMPQLAVIIDGGGGYELSKLEGRELFFGGGGRCNDRFSFRSAVVNREEVWRQGHHHRLGEMWY